MKEAAGEANMTVITIVLIGLVAAAGALFIPRLIDNMKAQSCCTEQGGTFNKSTGKCEGGAMAGKTVAQMRGQAVCQ
jgi:signal recognition particle receptor subunit beta